MLARQVDDLMVGEGLVYEPKWDGFRALAHISPLWITSKSGKLLTRKFPEVADALRDLPPGAMLDGEIVRWSQEGHLDFDALLRRNASGARRARELARGEPCHYVVFDLLELDGKDLSRRSLAVRRQHLDVVMAAVEQPSSLSLGWQTADPATARDWYDALPDVGIEGLVIKDSRRAYQPGRRDWLKYKHRATTEAIVGGVLGVPGGTRALLLGRYNDRGRLMIVGRTLPLDDTTMAGVGQHLTKARSGHPWPATITSRWGSSERIPVTRVKPTLVVEVEPDVAVTHGRWRHPVRLTRPRPDIDLGDVPMATGAN